MTLAINKRVASSGRSIHERRHRKRMVARTFIAIGILLLLLIVAAVVYVWYMGQHPSQPTTQQIDTTSIAPKLKPPTFDPNAPVGIVRQTFSGSVTAGSNAAITVKTQPKAVCQITVKVKETNLPDNGLVPKMADEFGMVDWSWTVPKNVPTGKWPVEITCANDAKKSGYLKEELVVTQ